VFEFVVSNDDEAQAVIGHLALASFIVDATLFTSVDAGHREVIGLVEVVDSFEVLTLAVLNDELTFREVRIDWQTHAPTPVVRVTAEPIESVLS
jgi:hypothetical protein